VVDEERMRSGHELGSMLCVSFSALTLMVGCQEGHLTHKNQVPLMSRGSVLEQVEEEELADPGSPGKKRSLNGSSSCGNSNCEASLAARTGQLRQQYICSYYIWKSA